MKIIVNKENFQRAIGFVEKVTSKNNALPILNNILLQTEKGRLRLAATNLEIGVVSLIGASVEREGQIAVPGRILADFIRTIQSETVTLSTKQNTLSVDGGSFHTTILCFDAAEYPLIPKIAATNTRTIPANTLQKMIATVTDSIAVSESRPELAGALFGFQAESTIVAATDSFRLVERRLAAQNTHPVSVIIPRVTLLELQRILAGVAGDIAITVADNQISFVHDDVEIISRLIDGKYPEYQKIIPDRSIAKVLIRKNDLENAIKGTALFSSTVSDIKIECAENTLTVTAKNSSKGEAQAAVEANLKGDPFDITINYHYLMDGLKVIETDKVVLEFTGKGSPCVLRPNDDKKEAVYIIMPLRN
jgi:DNA polymerase-3 subunit beta